MREQEIQKKRADEATESGVQMVAEEPQADQTTFPSEGEIPAVQAKGEGTAQRTASERAFGEDDQTHEVAQHGTSGAGQELPHLDQIAHSFGPEFGDTARGIDAHVGGEAKQASNALGAQAYAMGNSTVFAESPDLHTAAHEAAHVVQQQAGVHLKGGVGEQGDSYEQNADAVADRVVAGKPAGDLLAPFAGGKEGGGDQAVQHKAVQFLGHELGTSLPENAEKPVYGEDQDQRRYSREQYEKLWEEEQGRKLKPGEKETIRRGCIGITANNISGGGNPLSYAEATFGGFDQAHKYMEGKNKELHEMRANPQQAHLAPEGEYVLFAKLFWSNQAAGDNSKPDDKAFLPDEKTGRVDMSGYKYRGQPTYVNFDYGFWDDSTSAFWHANHMEYPDAERQKTKPMKVYQSTKDRFIRGYIDFDRIVFGVALAKNYDPGKAAMDAASRGGG